MPSPTLSTAAEALDLLVSLGAPPWLVRHHELVVEAAAELIEGVRRAAPGARFDEGRVLVGAALHDAGKVLFPAEMREPGEKHEQAGERLLLDRGAPPVIARVCRTHALWSADDAELEDRLVALADKLWKGKRDDELEARVRAELTPGAATKWDLFLDLDDLFVAITEKSDERLSRSHLS